MFFRQQNILCLSAIYYIKRLIGYKYFFCINTTNLVISLYEFKTHRESVL